MCGRNDTHLSGKRNTILFVNQLPVNLGKVKTADVEISDTTFLVPGTTSRFAFAGKRYELVAKHKVRMSIRTIPCY